MLRNNLKTALRFLNKNRLFTAINAMGLSIALAASFLILIYVINEMSVDHCHKRRKQIFRVLAHNNYANLTTAFTPYPVAVSLKDEFPQIQKSARIAYVMDLQLKSGNELIPVYGAFAADPEIFDIFTIPLVRGSVAGNILGDKNSIVLSEKQSSALFPGQDPVGKEIPGRINGEEHNFTVTGVYKDIPLNSTLQSSCFVNIKWSLSTGASVYGEADPEYDWNIQNWNTYILLSDQGAAKSMEDQLTGFRKKYPAFTMADQYKLQNLPDVYLHSDNIMDFGFHGDMGKVRLFLAISLVILLVAITNYIILSTAVSVSRAKETGIKKAFGATNADIRRHVLTESVLLVVLVLPLTFFLIRLALPYTWLLFRSFSPMIIGSNILVYIPVCLFLTFFTRAVSGLYTSGYLTRLKVLDILKNTIHSGPGKRYFRSVLIVIQLFIFCTLVTCTQLVIRQYRFANNNEPGYYRKDILYVYLNGFKGYAPLMEELKSYPEVIMSAMALNSLPEHVFSGMPQISKDAEDENKFYDILDVDYHFLQTMGITITQGRDFSEEFGSDLNGAVILNEKAVKKFNLTDPLGKKWNQRTIIGIVKDFHCYAIRYGIPAVIIQLDETNPGVIAIHYKTGTEDILIPKLDAAWKRIAPDIQFNYQTIESEFSNLYSDEKRLAVAVSVISFLTLLIAVSGLFGLTVYVAATRTKEIGIKKVLGSTNRSVLTSFLLEHVILVMIAAFLSIPATLYFMNRWLSDFAFRTSISWWIFALTFLGAMIIVLLTVFAYSFKASRTNPVNALRYE